MLENGLIDGLVELLVSNFQIRIARFAENEPPLEWETEEDILCFFKEIALFGCKNSTKEALLKEILLVYLLSSYFMIILLFTSYLLDYQSVFNTTIQLCVQSAKASAP